MDEQAIGRRGVLAGLAMLPLAQALAAQGLNLGGGALGQMLGRASDSSLDRLAQPGAFYNDTAIRIALPLVGRGGGALGSILGSADRLGLTGGLVRSLNDAAGLAAREAKPIFRTAIGRLSFADVPGIVSQSDGASQYLRRSAGDELHGKLRPLIDGALGRVGAFNQLDGLARRSRIVSAAGLTRDRLGQSVTEQALNGIFRYIGSEEGRLRANPLGPAGSVLGGILKN